MAYGVSGHCQIGFQNSFGTSNVDSFYSVPVLSENITETINQIESEVIQGRFERALNKEGTHEIAGDVAIEGHPIYMGVLLKGFFGQSSGTLTDSVTAHSFIPVTADFGDKCAVPPMTIECYRGAGSAHQYYDCCISDLSIEMAQGDVVKMTGSIIGANFEKVVKTTPSYLNASEYTWDQGSISLGGSGRTQISELSVTMANNLEAKHTLSGSKYANRIKRTNYRTYEISGTIIFENDTDFDVFRNQTLQRLYVLFVGQEISSGYNGEFSIDIPSLRLTEYPLAREGAGEIEVSFSGIAEYNTGSATAIEITLQNTQTAY